MDNIKIIEETIDGDNQNTILTLETDSGSQTKIVVPLTNASPKEMNGYKPLDIWDTKQIDGDLVVWGLEVSKSIPLME